MRWPTGSLEIGGEVHHRVEALQVLGLLVPDVAGARLVAVRHRTEVAAVVPPGVEADHLVAGLPEHGHEHRTDVSAVSVDQHPHV